jgi:broad specificity polyphosphatase/5'/3'-nucleotidase SurE
MEAAVHGVPALSVSLQVTRDDMNSMTVMWHRLFSCRKNDRRSGQDDTG